MSEVPFDKVVLSCDENPIFLPFAPLVIKAWHKFFPEVQVELGFVTNTNPEIDSRTENMLDVLSKYNNVNITVLPTVEGVHPNNLGKVGRLIVASMQGDAVCLLHDLDSLPLQREYMIKLVEQRKKDTILCVHVPEVYGNDTFGRFPMAPTTAEGYVFGKVVNPENLNYKELVDSWKDLEVYDGKEKINNTPDVQFDDRYFSDESLFRVLLNRFGQERLNITTNVTRDVAGIHYDWRHCTNIPDRGQWHQWNKEDLKAGKCIEANLMRPGWLYDEDLQPIIDYINS